MARPLRVEFPFAVYHVTSRGNARAAIFTDDTDRYAFLGSLASVVIRYNWLCHAYCLMDNHYHLLIETPDANLSQGMRQLNGTYTQAFNRRHDRVGHIFQGRFKAIIVEKDAHLLELCRYVVLNPVRAKMVTVPANWPWSSYQATVGLGAKESFLSLDWILSQFSPKRREAIEKYRQFVQDGAKAGSPWETLKGQLILGTEQFAERVHSMIGEKEEIKEIPRLQRLVGRPPLNALFSGAAQLSKHERDGAIFNAHMKHGYGLKEIADHLEMHYTSVSKVIGTRLREK